MCLFCPVACKVFSLSLVSSSLTTMYPGIFFFYYLSCLGFLKLLGSLVCFSFFASSQLLWHQIFLWPCYCSLFLSGTWTAYVTLAGIIPEFLDAWFRFCFPSPAPFPSLYFSLNNFYWPYLSLNSLIPTPASSSVWMRFSKEFFVCGIVALFPALAFDYFLWFPLLPICSYMLSMFSILSFNG